MFLSIVIPVYNASKYITKCLDSIWSQNLPVDDYEVICVDDGSRDDSLVVLNEIAKGHPNLRILQNPENLRAGGARNNGVRNARGEYILFVDSDDYFHEGSLKDVYEYQKAKRLDIFVGDMSRESYGGPVSTRFILNYKNENVMSGRDFLLKNGLPGGPTKYCFKRSLMTENNVWFAEKVASEDPDWVWKLPFYAKTMQYQPILIHHYVLYPNSSIGAEYKSSKAVFDKVKCARRIADLRLLYDNTNEKISIKNNAITTFRVGVLYFCALFGDTRQKINILKKYIPKEEQWGRLVNFSIRFPKFYSYFSTIVSPFFRLLIILKRKLFGRK